MNCTAKKKSGEPCGAVAVEGGLCAFHRDPERAAELGRKSGQSRRRMPAADESNYELKPPRTAKGVRDALGDAMSDLRAGSLDLKTASTLGYLAGVLLSSIEHSNTPFTPDLTVTHTAIVLLGSRRRDVPDLWGPCSWESAGNLYGASYANGTYHYGNVFKMTQSNGGWTYTDLYDFTGGNDGANPVGALILDGKWNLYGTTFRGGSSTNCFQGCGVVFEIKP